MIRVRLSPGRYDAFSGIGKPHPDRFTGFLLGQDKVIAFDVVITDRAQIRHPQH